MGVSVKRSFRRRLAAAVVVMVTAVGLLPAAGASASNTRAVTADDLTSRGPAAIKTLIEPAAEASETISGVVTKPGVYADDAEVSAVAFAYDGTTWAAAAGADVQSDGSYCIALPGPGTYRIGFFDAALVYKDIYYLNASSVTSATDVVVAANEKKTGINQTLAENPVNVVEGRVSFVGASPAPITVELLKWEIIDGEGMWTPVAIRSSKADGTYRVHCPAAGVYRLGFVDLDDVFGTVYYPNAATVQAAKDVTVTVGVPVAGIDVTMTALPSNRVQGANRFETAVELSKSAYEDGFGGVAVLVNGMNFPDSLAAGPLAYGLEGPMLLTSPSGMPEATRAEIERLMPIEVVIVGGPAAVPYDQEIELRDMGVPVVRRVMGRDRYETAAQVAQELVNRGLAFSAGTGAFIANGQNYPDALAAAPVASAAGWPILFVRPDGVPASTQKFFDKNGIDTLYVAGGTGAVSDQSLPDFSGDVERFAGQNRYDTAARIAAFAIDEFGFNRRIVGLCSGRGFADAMAAGPIYGSRRRAILLTEPSALSLHTQSFLAGRKGVLARIVTIGGPGAVSDAAFNAAVQAIQ
ncbi:MAG: cell wall-binding repeat-containing protein [Coriobacteriia bacterium]|nr:cell wall-binding repeat-containing protein [Coriobacteriia bacterium]